MKRGDIYYIETHQAVGSEMKKARPGIIVSNDILNDTSPVVEVVYLSTNFCKKMPTHATIKATGRMSKAKCEQIDSVSKERIGDYCGTCTAEEMEGVDLALLCSLGIDLVEENVDDCETCKNNMAVLDPDLCGDCLTAKGYPNWVAQDDDPVNHPSHYTDGKIEVIDFIEDKQLGFHRGNAVKYIARAGKKDPTKTVQDLEKAKWYIEREIARLEAEGNG